MLTLVGVGARIFLQIFRDDYKAPLKTTAPGCCISEDKMFSFVESWPLWAQLIAYVVGMGVGVFCLVKFCDIFVGAASAIAKKLKISPMIIGLTVVAMGTSLPELAVSTSDSIATLIDGGNANVAIGNVVGSNICNLLLVLGLSVVFTPIVVQKNVIKREFPMLMGVTVLLVLFICLFGLNSVYSSTDIAITRWESIVFIVIFIVYVTYLVLDAKRGQKLNAELPAEEVEIVDMPWLKAIVLVVLGGAGIILGGELVVFGAKGLALEGAVAIGVDHDLAEALIGLTIVAVGTSLPELVTSVVAAKKGENEIALGNVIGSNIFNALFVLGVAGTVNPLTSGGQLIVDAFVMLAATVLAFVVSIKGKLKKVDGVIFLVCYVGYVAYLIARTLVTM